MADNPIIVAGIVVPRDDSEFLAIVGLHVLLAFGGLVTGLITMLSTKGPGRHPRIGTIYYWCLTGAFISATALSAMRWAEDYHLFILGALSFVAASCGRLAYRRRWGNWLRLHLTCMGTSYILLVIAFYVDNGKSLPVWRDLPPITYWLLPAAVGASLIVHGLLRHPLVRNPRRLPRDG